MEKIRSYDLSMVRRAIESRHEVMRSARAKKISGKGGSNIPYQRNQMRQERFSTLVSDMNDEHKDWVNAKVSSVLPYLQKDTRNQREKEAMRQSLEEHYRAGITTMATIYSRTNEDRFDAQDAIISYTEGFLRMLKICEALEIKPRIALRLAQRSHTLDGRAVLALFKKYEGKFFKGQITVAAVGHYSDPEGFLTNALEQARSLSEHPNYRALSMNVLTLAAIQSSGDPRKYLDRYLLAHPGSSSTAPRRVKPVFKETDGDQDGKQVVFDARENQLLRRSQVVPLEVRRVGEQLKTVREKFHINEDVVAKALSVKPAVLFAFESGELVNLNPWRVYQVMVERIGIVPEPMKEMRKQIEILNWLHTFTQSKNIPKEKILGRGIRLLRLAEFDSRLKSKNRNSYAKKLHILPQTLTSWETGSKFPDQQSLNNIFENSVLYSLGSDNKAIQFLRLKSVDKGYKEGDDEPMTLERLQECKFGDLFRYLRRLKGATQEKLIEEGLPYVQGFISAVENNDKNLRLDENSIESFISWLKLSTNSALANILRHKAGKSKDQPISEEMLQKVLTEQYLFQEHLDQLTQVWQYPLLKEDRELPQLLNSMTVGQQVTHLRVGKKLKRSQFIELAKLGENVLSRIESGKVVPTESTLLRIAQVLGYNDIHNPILLGLLDQAAYERAA